jgi:hypothetical protein
MHANLKIFRWTGNLFCLQPQVTAGRSRVPIGKVKLISAAALRAFYEIWLVWCVLGAGFIRTEFCPPKVQPDSPTLNYYFILILRLFSLARWLSSICNHTCGREGLRWATTQAKAVLHGRGWILVRVTAWLGFAPIHKVKLISAAALRAFYEIWLVWCVLGAGFIRTKFCPPKGPAWQPHFKLLYILF